MNIIKGMYNLVKSHWPVNLKKLLTIVEERERLKCIESQKL